MEETNTHIVTDATVVEDTTPVVSSPEPTPTPPTLQQKFLTQRNIVIAIIAIGIIASVALYYVRHNQVDTVAVVNGYKISQVDFAKSVEMITQQAVAQGIDVTSSTTQQQINTQAIDVLVNNALLIQGAKEAGFVADPAKIQTEYEGLIKELGGEDALKARMTEVGLTEEKLRSNIGERLVADAFIESKTDIKSLSVTDTEIQTFYDSVKGNSTSTPPLDSVKSQIETQILGQKRQEVVDAFVASLRDKAKIIINLK